LSILTFFHELCQIIGEGVARQIKVEVEEIDRVEMVGEIGKILGAIGTSTTLSTLNIFNYLFFTHHSLHNASRITANILSNRININISGGRQNKILLTRIL